VINPLLVFNTALGLSVEDNSEVGGAFLGVDKLVYHEVVYPGDTMIAKSITRSKRLSAKHNNMENHPPGTPQAGISWVRWSWNSTARTS